MAIAWASPCRALGPTRVEVAALAGGGTSAVAGPDSVGFGFGGRAGVSVGNVYLGAVGMYFLGGALDTPLPGGENWHQRASSTFVGVEGGYDVVLGPLAIRPKLGVGYYARSLTVSVPADFTGNVPAPGVSSSFYVEPAAAAVLRFARWRAPGAGPFVGLDVGALIPPAVSNAEVSVVALGQVGVLF